MKYLQETYEINQKQTHEISKKLALYVKEPHHICQGNPSDMSRKHIIYISRTPFKYLQDTRQISPGYPSNI